MAQLNPLARFLAALCVSAGAPAQIVVSTLADSGPGSLRAAILTVSSSSGSQFTIRLDVAGTCRLASALPYLPSGKSVAIVAGFGSGRFEIDATAASANPVHGLLVRGAGSHLAAPLTVRLRNGVGVEVAFGAHDVRIDDLQVFGGGTGLKATAVANLRVRGVWAAGSGVGIHLENCTGARLGDAATGAQVAATGSLMQGILVQGGADNAFEVFTCADAPGSVVPGVLAVDTTDLVLGAPNGPRSAARDHGAHGVRFVRVTRGLLQHADLDRNGIAGVGIDGGAGNRVQDVRCDHNARSGIELGQDARSTTIGPAVVCSNTAGGQGAGLVIGATRDTRVVDSHFGPNNSPGVHVIPSAAGVSIEGGSIHDNFTGVFVSGVGDVSLVGTRIEHNGNVGAVLLAAPRTWLAWCTITGTHGTGVSVTGGSHRVSIGPGNFIDDNGFHGVLINASDDCSIAGNQSISRNGGPGIEGTYAPRLVIERNLIAGNAGSGIALTFDCNAARVGPGNVVRDSFGHGIKIEVSEGTLVDGNQVIGCSGSGVLYIGDGRPGAARHMLRSTLVAGNRDLGVLNRNAPTLDVVGCTIAANYRGIRVSGPSATSPTQVLVDRCILWGNQLDDYDNAASPTGVVVPTLSIVQNPPGTGSNRADDPRFVNPANDWRLHPSSPAIDAVDPPAGAVDLRDGFGGDRLVNCRMDLGAHELQRLAFTPDAMAGGGSRIEFVAVYPPADAGRWSLLLFSTAGVPRTAGSLFGHCLPLRSDAWTATALHLGPPLHANVLALVPGDGIVRGAIDYSNLLPPALSGTAFHAAGVAFSEVGPRVHTSTNVATFTIR